MKNLQNFFNITVCSKDFKILKSKSHGENKLQTSKWEEFS